MRSATITSVEVGFGIERTDLYGLGSMYPYGRRAVLPLLGTLNFSALATEFTSGNLNGFMSGENNYNFTFNIKDNCSGQTGLQMVVQNAQLDSQGLSNSLGDNASITASFGFSMSDVSGLKMSTPPLIVNQPAASSASAGDTLAVAVTGLTSSDRMNYGLDGFKYQWYTSDDYSVGATSTGSTFATDAATGAATYYVTATNELGNTTSNNSVVS